jgi:hypothetical protein
MASDHAALVAGLEDEGPPVLREHLREAAAALLRDAGRMRSASTSARR